MRFVSRLLAAAFYLKETYEEKHFAECRVCIRGPHDVINAFDSKEDRAQWRIAHHAETGHGVFDEYDMTRTTVAMIAAHNPTN